MVVRRKMTTSITVNPITLKWANKSKAFLNYIWNADIDLSTTLLMVCSQFNWEWDKRMGLSPPDETFNDYIFRVTKEMIKDMAKEIPKEEYEVLLKRVSKWAKSDIIIESI